jgi:formate hydrogenlyase transcriptional activator
VIERSVILCESEVFAFDETWSVRERQLEEQGAAPPWIIRAPAWPEAPCRSSGPCTATTLQEIEREAILRALQYCAGVVGGPNGAAKRLGIKRTTLQARMQKLGIHPARTQVGGSSGDTTERRPPAPLHTVRVA